LFHHIHVYSARQAEGHGASGGTIQNTVAFGLPLNETEADGEVISWAMLDVRDNNAAHGWWRKTENAENRKCGRD
jgi:hypothetical protein